jgi:hypothetical protein
LVSAGELKIEKLKKHKSFPGWTFASFRLGRLQSKGRQFGKTSFCRPSRRSDAGKFTVLFPGTPEEKVQTVQGPAGRGIEAYIFIVEADKQTFYGANYGDVPTNIDLRNPEMYFDKAQTLAAGEKGKIMFQQDIRAGGNPGREFEFVAGSNANYSGRFRILLIGRRMYTLYTIFLTTNPHPEDTETFFDSFSLSTRN